MSPISKSTFQKFFNQIPLATVIQKAVNSERGQRLWPSRTSRNDSQKNFRLDRGSQLADGRVELIIQANKNAENKGFEKVLRRIVTKLFARLLLIRPLTPRGPLLWMMLWTRLQKTTETLDIVLS
ncbi:hypothetical protein EJ08DRAFT_646265 [Tothia fuscella]|uniref:Uncharacterized protein n=1 Tax=Tothia fuscella TaxID=1048955 RepID=A0A9P4U2G1_9PEZI|nr:hypothetical protein EJ08DRAFT_646265 [Tothia fuscella]